MTNKIQNGWFSEINTQWPGIALSLEIEENLQDIKTEYQHVHVFKSKSFGNVLVLDGVIQLTERDEFAYHEMISYLPLNSHPNPKKVLVVGGGDGGTVRQVTKHPSVESVTLCEIDEFVIEAAKKFFPSTAVGFQSPKLTVHIGDGKEYMMKCKNEFDVIITDSSDPIGPAQSLFEKPYYELMKQALKPDGIICTQGETLWLFLPLIKNMISFCKESFPVVRYGYTSVPTYPSGQIGFVLCSKSEKTDFTRPLRIFTEEEKEKLNLKYYNEDVHRAAFILPQFAAKVVTSN